MPISTTPNDQEIWVFRVGSLGDALVALPAVHRIRRDYPGARLVLLTNHGPQSVLSSWEILGNCGVFADHLTYRRGNLGDMVGLAWRLWLRRPAKLFYLAPHRSPIQARRDRLFFRLVGGIKQVYGLGDDIVRPEKEMSIGVAQKEAERLLQVVDPSARIADTEPKVLLQVRPDDTRNADALLSHGGWQPGIPLVAMVPGSKMQSKRWPMERYVAVGRKLLSENDSLMIALLGSKEEIPLCQAVAEELGSRAIMVAGKTAIMEAAAMLTRATIYVGNDTGTMHLSAAMGVPGVAVFSARDAAGKWEPIGECFDVLRADVPCAGCMLETCIDQKNLCLKEISTQQVINSALRILKARGIVLNAERSAFATKIC